MFRGLLIWHSSYFAAALDPSNELLEGESNVLEQESKDDVLEQEGKDNVLEQEGEGSSLKQEGESNSLDQEGKGSALEQESKSNALELEEEIAVFDAFYCWVYTGQLKDPFMPQDPTAPQTRSVDDVYLPAITLCKIWVFADFRGIPGLGNAAINMLHERIAGIWQRPNDIIRYIYENTTKESKLRDFILHFYTRAVGAQRISSSNPEHFTIDFTLDVLAIFTTEMKFGKSVLTRTEWTKTNRCQWHDHSGPGGKLRLQSRS